MPLRKQISAFVMVGAFAAATHYGALIALVEVFGWPPVPSTLVGYLCGGITSYVLNRRHTFDSDRKHGEAIWRFVTVAATGFLVTWAIMTVFIEKTHVPYIIAQMITTGVVMVWSFLGNKLWTFRQV